MAAAVSKKKLYAYHTPEKAPFLVRNGEDFVVCMAYKFIESFFKELYAYYKTALPNGKYLDNILLNPGYPVLNELIRKLGADGSFALIPYSIDRFENFLISVREKSRGRLYGMDKDIKRAAASVRERKSKIENALFIKEVCPEFANDFTFAEKGELKEKARNFMVGFQCGAAIKPEYGQAGTGSALIDSEEKLEEYIRYIEENDYVSRLEIPVDQRFIIERYLDVRDLPSSTSFVGAANLGGFLSPDEVVFHSHRCAGMSSCGFFYPMLSQETDFINRVHRLLVEKLEQTDFLGVLGLSSLETGAGIKFCEINARFPDSFYLSNYIRHYFPGVNAYGDGIEIPQKALSLELFESSAPDGLFSEKKMRGLLPYFILNHRPGSLQLKIAYLSEDMNSSMKKMQVTKTKIAAAALKFSAQA